MCLYGGGVAAEIYLNRPDSRIYSAFLSKDNLLFFLSARSKQELENVFVAKVKVGASVLSTRHHVNFWLSLRTG